MAGLKVGTVFVLLMIYVVLGKRGVEGGDRRSLSRKQQEDDLELERQVKLLNKPAVKSIKTEFGDIYDCVDINKQPAFNHPLLRNHTIQMRPSSFPKGLTNKELLESKPSKIGVESSRCPPQTVLIRRTQKEDIIRAKSQVRRYPRDTHQLTTNVSGYHVAAFGLVGTSAKYYGGHVFLSLDRPMVNSINQFSEAVLWVENGPYDQINSIHVGWTVNPKLYGDNRTRMFSYWTADGGCHTGCYNLVCPGFVQVSRLKALGDPYDEVSIYGGQTQEENFLVFKDQSSGNWWFVSSRPGGHEPIGYWPSSLFTTLRDSANTVASGGEVYSATSIHSPQMGNGHLPPSDQTKVNLSSYVRRLQIVDERHFLVDPVSYLSDIKMGSNECYKMGRVLPHNDNWINSLLYGGPGGPCCHCN